MIFRRSLVLQRRRFYSSTCRSSLSVLLCLPLLFLLGPSAHEALCRMAQAGNLYSSLGYKLQNLHQQHDSGPQWLEIVKARGFIGELYTTVSRDNAPLSIYHIINPLADQRTLNKYPVLIFHGVLSDAAQMIGHSEASKPRAPILGEINDDPSDTALAFMLANNNFDVWMCDARGTNLNNHLVSDDFNLIQSQKYWNFSLDEQVHYDLPTIIDFVLAETFEDKLHYVGYSQSTYMMFALLSSQTEYHNKIASFTALAPVAYVSHIHGLTLNYFASSYMVPDSIQGNFVPQLITDTVSTPLRQLCQLPVFTHTMCPFLLTSISGKGDNAESTTFLGTALKSTSIKAIKHFVQQYLERRMAMYDYGRAGNTRQYGQPVSPHYHLENIKLPSIALIRGGNDLVSNPTDQKQLLAELGARPYLDLYYPNYNHVDTLIGRNIVKEVNLPAMQVMYDWTREWARREGLTTILKDPAKALLKKPVAPVAIAKPDGSRKITLGSNLVGNLVNSMTQTNYGKIVKNDGGQLLSMQMADRSTNPSNPLAAITGSLSSMLPNLG